MLIQVGANKLIAIRLTNVLIKYRLSMMSTSPKAIKRAAANVLLLYFVFTPR